MGAINLIRRFLAWVDGRAALRTLRMLARIETWRARQPFVVTSEGYIRYVTVPLSVVGR